MDEQKFKKLIKTSYIFLIIPTLLNAIIKSIELIHIPLNLEIFNLIFVQETSFLIIYLIIMFNIIFAILSIILLIISFGLIYSNKSNSKKGLKLIKWSNIIISITAITNLLVIFIILNFNELQPIISISLFSWFLTLIISIIFFLINLIKK